MDDDTNLNPDMSPSFLEQLRVAGQIGELMAFGTARPLERFKSSSVVRDQHERTRTEVLEWLKETDDPNWWIQATEQDVPKVFNVSSTWKNDSDAASNVDKRIRQAIQYKYGIDAVALDTTPPWDADVHEQSGPPSM